MSEIGGPGPIGAGPSAARAIASEARVGGPAATASAAPAGEVASVPPDPIVALFDQVASEVAAGRVEPGAQAVESAVARVIDREFSQLTEAVRGSLTAQVAAALVARPDFAARLERLLAPA